MEKTKISIITPCYYNQENLPVTFPVLLELEKSFPEGTEFEYIFVDDGSKDDTFGELKKLYEQHPEKVKIIKLSRNFGANNAAFAGISHSTGDCCVILAADLQDPPEVIPQLFKHWQNGYKLVLAQKTQREDSFLTRMLSGAFHGLMRTIVMNNAPTGGFDLWLFDKSLREELIRMDEKNSYLPYLFIWMGYEYVSIPITRRKREIGKSRWTLSKKVKSFIDSFVSFTYLPLRLISMIGLALGFLALVYAASIAINRIFWGVSVPGWSSVMTVMLVVSSFIMISLGVIGEYLYRTLDAARNRPSFIVDQKLGFERESLSSERESRS